MSFSKILVFSSLLFLVTIGVLVLFKKEVKESSVQELPIVEKKVESKADIPSDVDLVNKLFTLDDSKFSFVETVSYSSRVPWLKGRAAWVADYASYYQTSRHFIARSLNGSLDYFNQNVSYGDRFNVFKKDAKISFYLLIDVTQTKMWFYCLDDNKRILLKTYNVGLGRKDDKKESLCLTPLGKYTLGNKIAIYKPGVMGFFQDQKVEMIRIFGTRWIPFGSFEKQRGFGIHGAPWIEDKKTQKLIEDRDKVGKFESDGCIRLYSEDIEELFSIVITKPTIVEIVKNFSDAVLPGVE